MIFTLNGEQKNWYDENLTKVPVLRGATGTTGKNGKVRVSVGLKTRVEDWVDWVGK